MESSSSIDILVMSDNEPQLPRNTNLFNAWFVRIYEEQPKLLKSGRFRILML
jgi:hypothetical protein